MNQGDDFDYAVPEPPRRFPPFREMTPKDAKEHFEWFVGMSSLSCDLLIRAFHATGGVGNLDYSEGSLVPLWAWAMPLLRAEKLSPPRAEEEFAKGPEWFRKIGVELKDFTTGTNCLCMDIGFYIAEVLIRSDHQIHWGLWKKKVGPYNKAYLRGKRDVPFVPVDLVSANAWNAADGKSAPTALLDNLQYWKEKLRTSEV